jgi:pentatricopeptide repeat domain-containing protein 1
MAGWASRWLTDELTALGKQGSWEAAIATLASMSMDDAIVRSNVFHYTTIISSCSRAGQWEAATSTFSHMLKAGVAPNVHTYTTVISACTSGNRIDLACRAYGMMSIAKVKPNSHATTAMVAAWAKASEWRKCLSMIDQAESSDDPNGFPNVKTYTAAIDGCRRAGRWDATLRLLSRMEERGVAANDITYNNAINACGEAANWEAAMLVVGAMRSAGYQPIAFTSACVQKAYRDSPGLWSEDLVLVAASAAGPTQSRSGPGSV